MWALRQGAGNPPVERQSGRRITMFKVEDIQSYGKEQFETAVATATGMQNGLQAIASAYGDYTKKSYEDTKSAQNEYAKSAYETFVADSQKIVSLYSDLAKQAFKPLEGVVAKFTPAQAH